MGPRVGSALATSLEFLRQAAIQGCSACDDPTHEREIPVNSQDSIEQFLNGSPHAVVGASQDRTKYGNKVLRAYVQANRRVFPVNPSAVEVEGLTAYPNLEGLPERVHGISIITPPAVTESVIQQSGKLGIQHVWMQPGAESESAIQLAKQLGMNIIAAGPCLLVVVGFRELSGDQGQ